MVSFYRKDKAQTAPQITVRGCALDLEGRGVARDAQGTIFVPNLMPGEEALVQIMRAHHGIREGRLVSILTPSAQRQEGQCPQLRCGGCPLRHLPPDMAFAAKIAGVLRLLHKGLGDFIPQDPSFTVPSPALHYRRSARLSVRRNGRQVECGFHAARSAELCPLRACPALTPVLEALLVPLQDLVGRFSERRLLGHIDLLEGHDRAGVHFRLTGEPGAAARDELRSFAEAHQLVCSVSVPQGPEGRPQEQLIAGSAGDLRVDCGGILVPVRPSAFVQVNAGVNAALIREVLAAAEPAPGQKILDLYSGIGNFSFPLARAGALVQGAEVVQAMVDDANALALSSELKAQFVAADLARPEAFGALDAKAGVAVLDPGREGAPVAVPWLAASAIRRLVLISCNPQAAVRDLAVLREGGFTCTRLGILDMFPQTTHVECLLVLERSRA